MTDYDLPAHTEQLQVLTVFLERRLHTVREALAAAGRPPRYVLHTRTTVDGVLIGRELHLSDCLMVKKAPCWSQVSDLDQGEALALLTTTAAPTEGATGAVGDGDESEHDRGRRAEACRMCRPDPQQPGWPPGRRPPGVPDSLPPDPQRLNVLALYLDLELGQVRAALTAAEARSGGRRPAPGQFRQARPRPGPAEPPNSQRPAAETPEPEPGPGDTGLRWWCVQPVQPLGDRTQLATLHRGDCPLGRPYRGNSFAREPAIMMLSDLKNIGRTAKPCSTCRPDIGLLPAPESSGPT